MTFPTYLLNPALDKRLLMSYTITMANNRHIHIGFTGTQGGMTEDQLIAFTRVLIALSFRGFKVLHHGDCIGSDDQAHEVAQKLGFQLVIHPPSNDSKRAWKESETILTPKPYLERNHDIVDCSSILIATPSGPEKLRSGTWATIRYARKQGLYVEIVYP